MNAIYNHAVKQRNHLQQDIAKFEKDLVTAPISLQGSISATLVAFEKSTNQYREQFENFKSANSGDLDGVAETVAKAETRLTNLVQEIGDFKSKFKELKAKYNESNARTQLFSGSGSGANENPFNENSTMNKRNTGADSMNKGLPQHQNGNGNAMPMYDGLMKEQSIFQRGNAQLDLILEIGQQSLDDIIEQNKILEQVQEKMTNSLKVLGVSDATIHQINKRVFKDKLIFWIALFLLLMGMYFVLKWLR